MIVGIFAVVAIGSHSSPSTTGNSQAAISPVQSDDATFIEQHGNDPKALDERFSSKAQAECSSRADDYLRRIASHDFAWDDDAKGWTGVKFDKFSLQSPGVGMLSLLSTRAKLSNGFGAFEHVDFYCLYNAASGNFVRFSQTDPALDVAPVTGMAGVDPSRNGQSADPTAQASDVKEERAKDPQEEALRFGHAIDSDFDKRIALQCYDTMRVQNPEIPNQVQQPKAYTISQMQQTGVWTAHIIFLSGQSWKGVFCDFNASGELQLKEVYNY